MLLHDNRLNADVIEPVLRLFEKKRYRFVPLDVAQSDASYRIPDTYITKFRPMWGYRWASERDARVDGPAGTRAPKMDPGVRQTDGKVDNLTMKSFRILLSAIDSSLDVYAGSAQGDTGSVT